MMEETTKLYTFRKLNATDIFPMFKILSKIGINEFAESFGKDAVQKLFASKAGAADFATTAGIAVTLEMANIVLGNLPKCESEIFAMLANTSDLSVDDIKEMDISTFAMMVVDFVKKEEFKDFIKVVSELFK